LISLSPWIDLALLDLIQLPSSHSSSTITEGGLRREGKVEDGGVRELVRQLVALHTIQVPWTEVLE
jgi:hypothetical protein